MDPSALYTNCQLSQQTPSSDTGSDFAHEHQHEHEHKHEHECQSAADATQRPQNVPALAVVEQQLLARNQRGWRKIVLNFAPA